MVGREVELSDPSAILGEIDSVMRAAQRAAESARAGETDPRTDAAASGLDGKIRVTLGADGRVRELVLSDEALAVGASELARELTATINAAWGKTRSSDPAAGAAAAVDMAALASRVGQLREESLRSMGRITSALTDALAKIDRRLP